MTGILIGHTNWVGCATSSDDGTMVATGSNDETVRVWSTVTRRTLVASQELGSRVLAVAFTAARTCLAGCEDGSIRAVSVDSGQEVTAWEAHEGGVNALVVTPEGRRLLSAGKDGTVRLWRLPSPGDPREVYRGSEEILALATLPNGEAVIAGCGSAVTGYARVVELDDGTERWAFPKDEWVRAVAASPDGRLCFSGGDDGEVDVWDLDTGQKITELRHGRDWVRAVAVTPDGRSVLSAGDDHVVRIWDLGTYKQKAALTGHSRSVAALALLPNGDACISTGSEGEVRVWDLTVAGTHAPLVGHTRDVRAVTIAPDGRLAASGGDDERVIVWDVEKGAAVALLSGHGGQVRSVAVTPNGQRLASASWDGTVRVWDLEVAPTGAGLAASAFMVLRGASPGAASPEPIRPLMTLGTSGGAPLEVVAITPNGRRVLASGLGPVVPVWDLVSGEGVVVLSGHDERVNAMALTAGGDRVVTASRDGTARVWDLTVDPPARTDGKRWKIAHEVAFTGHTKSVNAVAITPDGTSVVTGSSDCTVRVWDLATGHEELVLPVGTHGVCAMAITPDGGRVVIGSGDGILRVWDLATDSADLVFTDDADWITGLALTPDGLNVVTSGLDGILRLWSVGDGSLLGTFTAEAPIESMALSHSGETLVAGDDGGNVHVILLGRVVPAHPSLRPSGDAPSDGVGPRAPTVTRRSDRAREGGGRPTGEQPSPMSKSPLETARALFREQRFAQARTALAEVEGPRAGPQVRAFAGYLLAIGREGDTAEALARADPPGPFPDVDDLYRYLAGDETANARQRIDRDDFRGAVLTLVEVLTSCPRYPYANYLMAVAASQWLGERFAAGDPPALEDAIEVLEAALICAGLGTLDPDVEDSSQALVAAIEENLEALTAHPSHEEIAGLEGLQRDYTSMMEEAGAGITTEAQFDRVRAGLRKLEAKAHDAASVVRSPQGKEALARFGSLLADRRREVDTVAASIDAAHEIDRAAEPYLDRLNRSVQQLGQHPVGSAGFVDVLGEILRVRREVEDERARPGADRDVLDRVLAACDAVLSQIAAATGAGQGPMPSPRKKRRWWSR